MFLFFGLGSILSTLLFLLVPLVLLLFLVFSGVMRLRFGRRGRRDDMGAVPPQPPPGDMIEGEFVDDPDDEAKN